MSKVCPFSIASDREELTECLGDECKVSIDGECVLTKISVSLMYCAKNLKKLANDEDSEPWGR